METITCMGCGNVIAQADSRAEAVELAFEADATFYEEPGEYECAPCLNARTEEFRVWFNRERRVMEAEALAKKQADDIDDFLARADMIRDEHRER